MSSKFIEKFNEINISLRNHFHLNEILEIRFAKVFKENKLKYISGKQKFIFLFLANDLIGFIAKGVIENFVTFYFIKTKNGCINLVGILNKYSENNEKKDYLVYNRKISKIFYNLLKNKFNEKWKP